MTQVQQLAIKVIPGASKVGLEWYGELLKVKVRSAPEKGKANQAVIALLAETLKLAPSAITVVSGHTTPLKKISITGLTQTELTAALPPR